MYIIAGLGNPGKEYEETRHNAGFKVIDRLSDKYNIDVTEGKFKGLIGKGVIDGNKVIIAREDATQKVDDCTFEENEVYAIDICLSSGEGKVFVVLA